VVAILLFYIRKKKGADREGIRKRKEKMLDIEEEKRREEKWLWLKS